MGMNGPAPSATLRFNEGRRYGRASLDASILVSTSALRPTPARACDIGCGGMGFFSAIDLAVGDHVSLEFSLPYCDAPFRVAATVRDRSGIRYGVEFKDLTSDQFGEIARVTATLSLGRA